MKKSAEEIKRIQELRRSNAASAVPSKKQYKRQSQKRQSLMIKLKKESDKI